MFPAWTWTTWAVGAVIISGGNGVAVPVCIIGFVYGLYQASGASIGLVLALVVHGVL